MGANHQKEIKFLCSIAQPTHGAITNIGSAHLEGFGDLEGVINTKKELYQFINYTNGQLFVNSDDELLIKLSTSTPRITYGEEGKLKGKVESSAPFLTLNYQNTTISSHIIGNFQFRNIMLAICIGEYFSVSIENIKKSIESYIPKNNR